MVSTCSLGVKTLHIFWCSSSWQLPGICRCAASAYGWSSLVDLNQPLREVFQIRTIQTDNPNAHSQRLLHGCGLWLPHHLIFAVESEQELFSRLASAVKRVLRHLKRIFDFSLMEHFLSMPNGLQHGENICIRWKPVHVTTSDWLWRYYQIIGSLFLCLDFFFPSNFLKRLTLNCVCPEVSSPGSRPWDLAKPPLGTVAVHICKGCAHLFAFSMNAHLIASVSLQGDLHVSQMNTHHSVQACHWKKERYSVRSDHEGWERRRWSFIWRRAMVVLRLCRLASVEMNLVLFR